MLTLCFIKRKKEETQGGDLSLCQRGSSAKSRMVLIELEAVCKRVALILCLRFKKDMREITVKMGYDVVMIAH